MTFPKSVYNQSCGSQMSRHFQFFNKRRDLDNPSGYPQVDIVLYADHPDNPEGGALNCSNVLCSWFRVYYNFPPGPGNIDIILDPPDAVQGEPATITCYTIDGFPKVSFGIRAFSLVYNLELFYSPSETLAMPAAVAGTYSCEAITYIFGQKVVVPSDKKIAIVRRHEKVTDDVTVTKSNWNHVVKFWSRDISMIREKDEQNEVDSTGRILNPVYAIDKTGKGGMKSMTTSVRDSTVVNVEGAQSPQVNSPQSDRLILSKTKRLSIGENIHRVLIDESNNCVGQCIDESNNCVGQCIDKSNTCVGQCIDERNVSIRPIRI
ncbi:hypothetical protein Btru_050419 [Bulinus truncatus]|nr:hypothetical protein Btru_050419 [Bulinus truncatus]